MSDNPFNGICMKTCIISWDNRIITHTNQFYNLSTYLGISDTDGDNFTTTKV